MDTEFNKTCYRGGWIAAMKAIQDNDVRDFNVIAETHTEWFAVGYYDAIQHFEGSNGGLADYAYTTGLVEVYEGFYGQSAWVHPNP